MKLVGLETGALEFLRLVSFMIGLKDPLQEKYTLVQELYTNRIRNVNKYTSC